MIYLMPSQGRTPSGGNLISWCGSMAEQLICNQQVDGSTPFTSSKFRIERCGIYKEGAFPSGQRGQTVNLLSVTSVVRIHPLPPKILVRKNEDFYFLVKRGLHKVMKSDFSALCYVLRFISLFGNIGKSYLPRFG